MGHSIRVPISGTDHRRLRENFACDKRREDGRSELQVLHKAELGDTREHVNRLVDFGEAPEGGFPSWSLRARDVLRDKGTKAKQVISLKNCRVGFPCRGRIDPANAYP